VPSVIVTEPTAPVADKPVTLTETPVPSVIVTEPTEPVADKPVTLTEVSVWP